MQAVLVTRRKTIEHQQSVKWMSKANGSHETLFS
nr:MAG TPA: hypothetical protein [Caudoviricetes sp.]DAL03673.1 MAG TPA: hypothetical protein [Caudoviricetes sp.]